ncbi:MAG: hypothetical protein ACREQ5_10500, partial [Candidatus Dormibacteria bacterium]
GGFHLKHNERTTAMNDKKTNVPDNTEWLAPASDKTAKWMVFDTGVEIPIHEYMARNLCAIYRKMLMSQFPEMDSMEIRERKKILQTHLGLKTDFPIGKADKEQE